MDYMDLSVHWVIKFNSLFGDSGHWGQTNFDLDLWPIDLSEWLSLTAFLGTLRSIGQRSRSKFFLCVYLNFWVRGRGSVGNSHRSAIPRPTTLEEDRERFDFSSILCLWFEIQGLRTYNFFDWVSNTGRGYLNRSPIYNFSVVSGEIFLKIWFWNAFSVITIAV